MRGFVYVLYDPSAPRRVKLGRTTRDPELRRLELSGSGLPDELQTAYYEWSPDCQQLEQVVHRRLAAYRVNPRREFFDVSIQLAIDTIQSASHDLAALQNRSGIPGGPVSRGIALTCDDALRAALRKARKDLRFSPLPSLRRVRDASFRMSARTSAILGSEGRVGRSRGAIDTYVALQSTSQLVQSSSLAAETLDHLTLRNWLRDTGQPRYRFSVGCNSAGAVAASLLAATWAEQHGYEIHVAFTELAGRQHAIHSLLSEQPYHILVTGQPALSFARSTILQAGLGGQVARYCAVMPLHEEAQVLLVRPATSRALLRRIYVPGRSAAEEPHRTGEFSSLLARTQFSGNRRCDIRCLDVNEFETGRVHIEVGGAVQIWKPTDQRLRSEQGLIQVRGFKYSHFMGLFVHDQLVKRGEAREVGDALCRLLIRGWTTLQRNPHLLYNVFLAAPAYLESLEHLPEGLVTLG